MFLLLLLTIPFSSAICIKNIESQEEKIYSQYGEDGIIRHIFKKCINTSDKYFIEIGTQSGIECNTRYLREFLGWSGLMFDSDYEDHKIGLFKHAVTVENVVALFKKYRVKHFFDLLSIDIDLNTFWVLLHILKGGYQPRVIITEINRNFGTLQAYTTAYMQHEFWGHNEGIQPTCYQGASIMAYQRMLSRFGYKLVYVTTQGINAFFIKNITYTQILDERSEKWQSLSQQCPNTLWVRIDEDVDFISESWGSHLKYVILKHFNLGTRRGFYEVNVTLF